MIGQNTCSLGGLEGSREKHKEWIAVVIYGLCDYGENIGSQKLVSGSTRVSGDRGEK